MRATSQALSLPSEQAWFRDRSRPRRQPTTLACERSCSVATVRVCSHACSQSRLLTTSAARHRECSHARMLGCEQQPKHRLGETSVTQIDSVRTPVPHANGPALGPARKLRPVPISCHRALTCDEMAPRTRAELVGVAERQGRRAISSHRPPTIGRTPVEARTLRSPRATAERLSEHSDSLLKKPACGGYFWALGLGADARCVGDNSN